MKLAGPVTELIPEDARSAKKYLQWLSVFEVMTILYVIKKTLLKMQGLDTCVCVDSQSGELAHVVEGVIREGTDFIVAQISAEEKKFTQYTHRKYCRS